MKSPLPSSVSLLASLGLHALVLGVAIGSARGAPADTEDLEAARLIGNTFEIDTLVDTVEAPASEERGPNAEAPSVPPAEPEPAQAVEGPSPAPPREPTPAEEVAKPPEVRPKPESPELAAAEASPVPEAAPQAPAPTPLPEVAPREPVAAAPADTSPAPLAPASPGSSAEAGAPAPSGSAVPTYGQSGLPANVATLAKGFTRAVPRAASPDPIWHELPMGNAGRAVFSIEIDADGKVVGQGTVDEEPKPAPHLKRIIGRAVLMLKQGTFALSEAGVSAGVQRFELSAEIHQVAALDDVLAEPHDLRQIGRLVEPTRVRPGKANFTYNSGRQVELTVRMLPN